MLQGLQLFDMTFLIRIQAMDLHHLIKAICFNTLGPIQCAGKDRPVVSMLDRALHTDVESFRRHAKERTDRVECITIQERKRIA